MNAIAENDLPEDNEDDGLGLGESLSWDDIKRWITAMHLVDEVIVSLRTAQTDTEIVAAKQRLYLEMSRARDYESSATYYMRRYGYSDGVNVPGVGRFRVRRLDDGMSTLEQVS